MSTKNKRALEIGTKVSEKFGGAFGRIKKKKKGLKKRQQSEIKQAITNVEPIHEVGYHHDTDASPPADDSERLSKRDDEESDSNDDAASSDGELPQDNVPEVFSDEEEEEADTREM